MNTFNENTETTLSRRSFLKAVGFTTAAFAMPNVLYGITENPGVTSMVSAAQTHITTDVLVIGGGMAGAFAAATAKELELNVTLVDKGVVGRSGMTPWANTFSVFDEAAGHDRDTWITNVASASEYLNNPDWLEQMMDEAGDRWDDLEAWGMFEEDVRHPSLVLRDKLVADGVELVERTMLTTLITQDNSKNSPVIGAMGFSLDNEDVVVVQAKATIMCAGAGSFKAPGFPMQGLTSDGDAMAYRVGAIISGKEWIDFHWTSAETPASCWNQWGRSWGSFSQTSQVMSSGMTLDGAFAIHTGESMTNKMGDAPGGPPPDGEMPEGERPSGPPPDGEEGEGGSRPGQSSGEQISGAATGLGIHKAEGIWPTNLQGACNIPGLYAAGDSLASMLCGSSYAGIGFSLAGSAVQGFNAAYGAAEYAQQAAESSISEATIASLQEAMFAPRELESGFSPAWVTQVLQNTMFPYFVLFVKHEERLQAALSTIMFLQENMVPRLTAKDAHELKLAHETANMLLNAEMKLRASLARTESRGTHYREDYPARNDDEWLAWVLLQKDDNGQMTVTKEAIPDEWMPDLSTPYEERYTTRFPGELEYLRLA